MKVPLALTPEDLRGADVAVLGAPMDDLVTHRPGARFGPRSIRAAIDGGDVPKLWHMDLGVDPFADLSIVDYGDAECAPARPEANHAAIERAVGEVADAGAVPIVLGGDHSIAYPSIKAVAERLPAGSLAVVQLDTHTDTAEECWDVKYSHGSPFRHLVDEGHLPGEQLVQVGIRGCWPNPPEFAWARDRGVRWHRMDEVFDRGIEAVMDDVLLAITDVPHLYLSVDIDVLDPAFAPGTGTPEPGGMTSRELLRAVRRLVVARGLAGMDVVEVSPPFDHAEVTALAAHRTVLEALSSLAVHRRQGHTVPEEPSRV